MSKLGQVEKEATRKRMGQDMQVSFLSVRDIKGPKPILYTTLQSDDSEHGEDIYVKNSVLKLTLVLEMVGVMVSLPNVNGSEKLYPLNDNAMHQIALSNEDNPS